MAWSPAWQTVGAAQAALGNVRVQRHQVHHPLTHHINGLRRHAVGLGRLVLAKAGANVRLAQVVQPRREPRVLQNLGQRLVGAREAEVELRRSRTHSRWS